MKKVLILTSFLVLASCTTLGLGNLSLEQQLQVGCSAVPVIVNDLAVYRQAGKLSSNIINAVDAGEGPVKAVCQSGVTDMQGAIATLSAYLNVLTKAQLEVE